MAVKRVAVSKRETLTEDQVDNLLSGWNLGPEAFKDEQERRAAWFAHRDPLMGYIGKDAGPGFYSQHGLPWGTRPSGWWSYESPGPRRRIRNTSMAEALGRRMHKGIPASWTKYLDTDDEFESEITFLKRHGLLSAQEALHVQN